MPSEIGSVPLYLDDNTGEVFVDPEDVDETGIVWPWSREARMRRIDRRIDRNVGRRERLLSKENPMNDAPIADVYQAAAAAGMITENQFNGLGSATVAASGTGTLSDTINRNLWGKSLVLDSDDPAMVLVTAITVAGLPLNVGARGAPLSMFQHDSTRFGISFGRRLALTGQTFQVNLSNIDAGSGHTVSGGIIADELNPYAMQKYMETMLLHAAAGGFDTPGWSAY
jgi:hypothetical protein